MEMARLRLFRWVLGSFALLALCVASAQAAPTVVQYNGNLGFGFGDLDIDGGEGPDFANNAVPPCTLRPLTNMGGVQPTSLGGATTASVNFDGLATIDPAAAFPQAVKFMKQTRLPGPPNLGAVGTAAHGGLTLVGCKLVQLGFGPAFTRRTQLATMNWPDSTATLAAGGGFGGPAATPFTFKPLVAPLAQQISATAVNPAVKFGGAAVMAGIGDSILGVNIAPVPGQTVYVGTLPVNFAIGGSGPSAVPPQVGPTRLETDFNPFYLQTQAPVPANCVPLSQAGITPCVTPPVTPGRNAPLGTAPPVNWFAFGVNFPWTTGRVIAKDNAGDFTTTRTRTGFDNRTPNGTHGTLQLVTPNVLLISSVLTAVGLATTAEMTLTFVPEPAATTLLASGVLLLGGLYVLRRRKR
jgi:hypothetical protein